MNDKMKAFVKTFPGINSLVKRLEKEKKEIESLKRRETVLQTEIEIYKKELKELQVVIGELKKDQQKMEDFINSNSIQPDLFRNKLRLLERRSAYGKYFVSGSVLTEKEKKMIEEMRFLEEERPFVSIIMLNRNGRHNLEILLASLEQSEFYSNFELICVDNASSDDSIAYLEEWKEKFCIHIIRNQENLSFSVANNMGAKQARGEFLLFLNNDIQVTDGWLDELLIAIKSADKAGAVGAKLIYPKQEENSVNQKKSYCIQHSGIAFQDKIREDAYFLQPYNMDNGRKNILGRENLIERACVTAAILLVRKTVFEEVGGFDEQYVYGYEDVDFGLKLREAGYKNYLCPACIAYHYEFGTQSKDIPKEVWQRRSRNMHIFKTKWQKLLEQWVWQDKVAGRFLFTETPMKICLGVSGRNSALFETAQKVSAFLIDKNINNVIVELAVGADIGLETDILICFEQKFELSTLKNRKDPLVVFQYIGNGSEDWNKRNCYVLESGNNIREEEGMEHNDGFNM